ncbi:MAG TPA: ATP-binding protein [Candidatus Saccharimonadales bacterium]|nr:ATP-binding protein [Candidatus Saccharimonadales bacterium]
MTAAGPLPPPSGPDALRALLASPDPAHAARSLARIMAELSGRPVALALPEADGTASPEVFGAGPNDAGVAEELSAAATRVLMSESRELVPWAAPEAEPTGRPHVVPLADGAMVIAALALPGEGGAVALDAPHLAAALAVVMAWKLERDRALSAAAFRDRQRERWFKTVDAQLRLLDRERQKFHALVNRSDASVVVLGPDRIVRWVNPVALHTHTADGDSAALLGRPCRELCGAPEGSCAGCPVEDVLQGAPIAHREMQRELGGVLHDLYLTALPIRAPDGSVDEVLLTFQDLTGLEVLRRSEARLRQLFERSADAILMVEPAALRVVQANSTAHHLLGGAQQELVGRSLADLLAECELERLQVYVRQLLAGRSPGGMDLEMTPPAGPLLCNMCGARFDLDGTEVLMMEFRDVTEVRRLERELANADRLAALGTMSAGIAHEFKNRLAPLRGLVQLLSQGAPDAARIARYGPMMLNELDRLARLVRDVLDAARPQTAHRERHDLVDLVRQFVAEFRLEFEEQIAARGLGVRGGEERVPPLPVRVDVDQLRAVFQNVLKNALEACRDGDEIHVACALSGLEAIATVRDTGAGMEPAVLDRIHEPFFSTKGAHGTGLGMCIVKSLVEANGGVLVLRSQPGQGTEVEMRFEALAGSGELEGWCWQAAPGGAPGGGAGPEPGEDAGERAA